ncbi:tetraacyldisaccharide 4'-kinase [Halothiobacillus sp.]|uniref:tetraacyldisaccharide 4'-kinase n=1 Tax=Halothiobacillus sp. TaxID=1891311 RepID=UPI002629D985|nr:tetraacyldisaccharide 4'-kinase [Halothiobacillus sp.]
MWYPDFWQRRGLRSWLLWPLSLVTCMVARRRRAAAARGAEGLQDGCPVVVIGNITVGGTGKTPVLIALASTLAEHGRRVGVISRGYGAKIGIEPRDVSEAAGPDAVGDEPWLIHHTLNVPVFVHPDRLRAALQLRARHPEVDVILSDDGLQHHALPREVEIVVIDGVRRLGNRLCLPAGPLRESAKTLDDVDFVIVNGEQFSDDQWAVHFELTILRDLFDQSTLGMDDFILSFGGQPVVALAGIGHPEKFFTALRDRGLSLETYALDDHQPVPPALIHYLRRVGSPIVMTEKDAVKWQQNRPSWHDRPGQVFAVIGQIRLPDELVRAILDKLQPQPEFSA